MTTAFQANAFQNNAFQIDAQDSGSGSSCVFHEEVFDTDVFDNCGTPDSQDTYGGWLTAEQAAAQLKEIARREKQEAAYLAKIRAKARRLEQTIEDAWAGKKPRWLKEVEKAEPIVLPPDEAIEEVPAPPRYDGLADALHDKYEYVPEDRSGKKKMAAMLMLMAMA